MLLRQYEGHSRARVLQFAAMNQTLIVLTLIVVLPFFALTRSAAQDVEITAEPSHHVALENAYVRAFKVEVAPHAATLTHWHRHDYFFLTLGDAHLSNEVVGRAPVELKLFDGDARFTPGNFAHVARNLADAPFRNVTIELLQDEKMKSAPAHWDKDSGEETFIAGHRKILFVKDGVRVSQIELSAKAALPKDESARPRLLVAITEFELGQNADGKGSSGKALKAGDMWWSEGSLALTNAGSAPAKFALLEF
jgi:hypothetical protein